MCITTHSKAVMAYFMSHDPMSCRNSTPGMCNHEDKYGFSRLLIQNHILSQGEVGYRYPLKRLHTGYYVWWDKNTGPSLLSHKLTGKLREKNQKLNSPLKLMKYLNAKMDTIFARIFHQTKYMQIANKPMKKSRYPQQ